MHDMLMSLIPTVRHAPASGLPSRVAELTMTGALGRTLARRPGRRRGGRRVMRARAIAAHLRDEVFPAASTSGNVPRTFQAWRRQASVARPAVSERRGC